MNDNATLSRTTVKRYQILAIAMLTLAGIAASDLADAKRLGGGRSIGTQRQSIAPSTTSPGVASNPVLPAKPGATTPPAAPAGATPSGTSRWLGPIAGLAAGLGLAALLAHFGLSEGFASVLLLALVLGGGVLLVRMLFARRPTSGTRWHPVAASRGGYTAATDLSRPARGMPRKIEPVLVAGEALPASNAAPGLRSDFDKEAFLRNAKLQFKRLQAAYDTGDRDTLSDVMTKEMAADVERDLEARGPHHATEVVTLNADVLEVGSEADAHWVSVRFTGLLREDGAANATPFDEIWHLTKPIDGSAGWLLAGIQQPA
jgi:predicted lipid-binding transport protein (Tim44 family)